MSTCAFSRPRGGGKRERHRFFGADPCPASPEHVLVAKTTCPPCVLGSRGGVHGCSGVLGPRCSPLVHNVAVKIDKLDF